MAPEKSRPRSPESRKHSAAHASESTICAANPASEASTGRNAAAPAIAARSRRPRSTPATSGSGNEPRNTRTIS